MKLENYLKYETKLEEKTIILLDELFDHNEFEKGHILLSEGNKSQKIFYVEEGLLRLYYNKDGKDITQQFFVEKMFYKPIENILLNKNYPYQLELLEAGKIRTANFNDIEIIMETDKKLQYFVRFMLTTIIKTLSDRLFSIQFQSAQERYNALIENEPELLLRVSLGHIASYLGITQSTLSVIRASKK
ncbi:MAG: Crp/Fnr family transcriptional regulator [Flavobacterium sp.]